MHIENRLQGLDPAKLQYNMDHLVEHLINAKQENRLCTLLDSEEWMLLRVKQTKQIYEPYRRDINAIADTIHNSDTMSWDQKIPFLIKGGLALSQIVSLAVLPINLIMAAARTQYFSPEHIKDIVLRSDNIAQQMNIILSILRIDSLGADYRETFEKLLEELALSRLDALPVRYVAMSIPYLVEKARAVLRERLLKLMLSRLLVTPSNFNQRTDDHIYLDEAVQHLRVLDRDQMVAPARLVLAKLLEQIKLDATNASKHTETAATKNPDPQELFDQLYGSEPEPELLMGKMNEVIADLLLDSVNSLKKQNFILLNELVNLMYDAGKLDTIQPVLTEWMTSIQNYPLLQSIDDALDIKLSDLLSGANYEHIAKHISSLHDEQPEQFKDAGTLNNAPAPLPILRSYMVPLMENQAEDLIKSLSATERGLSWQPDKIPELPEGERGILLLGSGIDPMDSQVIRPFMDSLALSLQNQGIEPVKDDDHLASVTNFLMRAGRLFFLMMTLDLFYKHTGRTPTNKEITELVAKDFDTFEIDGAIALLDTVPTHEENYDKNFREQLKRRIKGAVLGHLLIKAYIDNSKGIEMAWDTVPSTLLGESDLDIILDAILTLPMTRDRNQFSDTMFAKREENKLPARITALKFVAGNMDATQAHRFLHASLQEATLPVKQRIVDLLSHVLSAEDVIVALRDIQSQHDYRGLAHLMVTLAEQTDLHGIDGEIWNQLFSNLNDGQLMGELIMAMDNAHHPYFQSPGFERIFKSLHPHFKLDYILYLARRLQRDLPPIFKLQLLELPPVSDTGLYSWLGLALTEMSNIYEDSWIEEVWKAALTLPKRLNIGDGRAWGWHWSYEFPQITVIDGLIDRLDSVHLRTAFDFAKDVFWEPRELVLQKISSRADHELAREILQFVLQRLTLYHNAEQQNLGKLILNVEQTVWTKSAEAFNTEREQRCADIVAALAPNLRESDLEIVISFMPSFTNLGPHAWLPGQIMAFLTVEQRRPLLAKALMAALEFVNYDPIRIDLVQSLMPYYKPIAEQVIRPLREIIEPYIPNHPTWLLNQDEASILPKEVYKAYRACLINLIPPEQMEVFKDKTGKSEEETREALIAQMYSPIMAANIRELLVHSIVNAPAPRRITALKDLQVALDSQAFRRVVDSTLNDLLRNSNLEIFTEHIAQLIPWLESKQVEELIAVILRVNSPQTMPFEWFEQQFFEQAIRSDASEFPIKFDEMQQGKNVIEFIVKRSIDQPIDEARQRLYTKRTHLLKAMFPVLSQTQLGYLALQAINFAPSERLQIICDLLPLVSDDNRVELIRSVVQINSPFASFWMLWETDREWMQRYHNLFFAPCSKVVRRFSTPSVRIMNLVKLQEYAKSRSTKRKILLKAVAQLDEIIDVRLRTYCLNLLGRLWDDTAYQDIIFQSILKVTDPESQFILLNSFLKNKKQVASTHYITLQAMSLRLISAFRRRPREDFLMMLSYLLPIVHNHLIEGRAQLNILHDVFKRYLSWNWMGGPIVTDG